MDLTRQIDLYCERLGPGLWAEPVNALTNLAFLLVALVMWRRSAGLAAPRLLSAILFVIGLGSFAFHTAATLWAAMAESLPILGFALTYIYATNRFVLGWSDISAALGTLAYLPFAWVVAALLAGVPFFGISAGYWSLPLLMALYAGALWRREPEVARGLAISAGLLTLSLAARSLDAPLCAVLGIGTHFLWHLLNAVLLGWMIEVLRRHLAGRATGG